MAMGLKQGLIAAGLLALTLLGSLLQAEFPAHALGTVVPAAFKPTKEAPLLPTLYQNACKWTVLYFYSPTCSACLQVKPMIESLSDKLESKVKFVWVDVTQAKNRGLSSLYNVQFTPSYMVYNPLGRPTLDMTRDLDHQLLQTYLNGIRRNSIQPSC